MNKLKQLILLALALSTIEFAQISDVYAQDESGVASEIENDFFVEVYEGVVLEVQELSPEQGPLDYNTFSQELTVRLSNNDIITFNNDFIAVDKGNSVYIRAVESGGELTYMLYDYDRTTILWGLAAGFVIIVLLVGGFRAIRALLSLVAVMGVVLYVFLPLMANGYSPVTWGIGIAIVLLALAMGITHGLNRVTLTAFLGTSIAVIVTGAIAFVSVKLSRFTGLGTEESFALQVIGTQIDLPQLLLAGIVIGILGVLDDVSITQASLVAELKKAGREGKELFTSAMKVGRDHIGALINTLVLAYAGASLPLFILLSTYEEPLGAILSIELVAAEIMRSLIGSMGLVIAVPITTFLAMLIVRPEDEGVGHSHPHHH